MITRDKRAQLLRAAGRSAQHDRVSPALRQRVFQAAVRDAVAPQPKRTGVNSVITAAALVTTVALAALIHLLVALAILLAAAAMYRFNAIRATRHLSAHQRWQARWQHWLRQRDCVHSPEFVALGERALALLDPPDRLPLASRLQLEDGLNAHLPAALRKLAPNQAAAQRSLELLWQQLLGTS